MMKKKVSSGIVAARRDPKKDWQLYLFLLVPVVYILVFKYAPMGGSSLLLRTIKSGKVSGEAIGSALKILSDFFSRTSFGVF